MVSRDPGSGRPQAPPRPQKASPAKAATPARPAGGPERRRRHDPQPALGYLAGTELWSTWQQLAALGRDLNALVPRLALVPLKLDRQTLVVTAGSPAVAARLRQFEPRLIEGLRARGWLLNRIRFRPIAIHDIPSPPAPVAKKPVSAAVINLIEAAGGEDLPPALAAAMRDFVKRQRSYRDE